MRQHFKHDIIIASVLLGVGLVLGYVESLAFPQGIAYGVKIGISNIVVLFALFYFKLKTTYVIAILKSLLSGLLFSSLTAVAYSMCGVLLSVALMSMLKKFLYSKKISVIGISIAGSAIFNIGQISVACFLTKSFACMNMLVYMLPLSVVTGGVTGIIIILMLNRIKRRVYFEK